MPKRISRSRRPRDLNQLACQLVQESTKEHEDKPIPRSEISRVMSEMGRRGGKKGGKRRLQTMTPEERSQIALKAAQVRWARKKKTP